jgi:hypothetical protein
MKIITERLYSVRFLYSFKPSYLSHIPRTPIQTIIRAGLILVYIKRIKETTIIKILLRLKSW